MAFMASNDAAYSMVVIFVLEVCLKILSFGREPWMYFVSGWNCFDFGIVIGCLAQLAIVEYSEDDDEGSDEAEDGVGTAADAGPID